jgi:hypothetical protein
MRADSKVTTCSEALHVRANEQVSLIRSKERLPAGGQEYVSQVKQRERLNASAVREQSQH